MLTQFGMRAILVLILVLISETVVSQGTDSKSITIELSDITLEEALTILAISYDIEFSYSDDVVPTDRIINLSIQNADMKSALDKLFGMLNLGYQVVNKRVLIKRSSTVLTQIIRGSVHDAVTNAAIPGATVLVKSRENHLGTATDASGRFKIYDIPVGRMSIVASCIGYNSQIFPDVLLGTGKELVLDFSLQESITAMNELVISAPSYEALPGDGIALTSSNSFSVEESKRYAGSMGDPARMATVFAGVSAASDESNALIVRGNSPRGVLWRIEGIEVPNPNHFTSEGASGGVVSILSPNVVESSDFLTGAFPAQYGNALSGIFDIRLRNGNNERDEYAIQAGLLGIEFSAEGTFSEAHKSSYLVNYRYSTLSVMDKFGFDLNEAGQYKDYQDLAFKINRQISPAGNFSIFGVGGKSESDKNSINLFDQHRSDVGVIGLTYENQVGETTHLRTSISLSGTEITRDSEISGANSESIKVEESYGKKYARGSISVKKRINSHYVLEGGITYSLINFDFYLRNRDPGNQPYQEIINFQEDGNSSVTQGYLVVRQYFSPTLFGFYSVHFLNFALTSDRSIEPRVGMRWQLSESSSLSAAFGKHSKIENLQYYLGRDHQTGGAEVQVNKNLGFTRANHFGLALDQILFSKLRFKIEPYYQHLYNAPVQVNSSTLYSSINEDTGFITDTLVNLGKGRNYGLEVSVEKNFSDKFYYLLNASIYESKFKLPDHPE